MDGKYVKKVIPNEGEEGDLNDINEKRKVNISETALVMGIRMTGYRFDGAKSEREVDG